jgi:hypothetical protein
MKYKNPTSAKIMIGILRLAINPKQRIGTTSPIARDIFCLLLSPEPIDLRSVTTRAVAKTRSRRTVTRGGMPAPAPTTPVSNTKGKNKRPISNSRLGFLGRENDGLAYFEGIR